MDNKILSFGEIMLRLTPPDKALIAGCRTFDACYGGSESNVLVALSCLGHRTEYLTALPDNPLGEATVRHLRSYGVGTGHIIRSGDVLGMYFLEEGQGDRPSAVVYHRKYSEVAKLGPDAFDYDAVFAGCTLFHICGISFALSQSTRALAFRLVEEARARSIPVSFDFNYRGKLWTVEEAGEVFRRIVPLVDILFCSGLDLTAFLRTDAARFHRDWPCSTLIVRERELNADGSQCARAAAYRPGSGEAPAAQIGPVRYQPLERIGSGDAFVAGALHVLSRDPDVLAEALEYGMACFVLKHTEKGDVFTLGDGAVRAYLSSRSKDVSR